MYIHTLTCFCEYQRRFPLLLSLKYITYSFLLSALSVPSLLPCLLFVPLLHRSPRREARREARRAPLSSYLPSFRLSSAPAVCCVFRGCLLPYVLPLSPSGAPLKLSGGLLCVLPCVVLLPSLVSRQAQNAVTVWANAPRVCPRPCLLLPMCCRVFRCPFRGLSCGFLPCVRVCVLPCVVWW